MLVRYYMTRDVETIAPDLPCDEALRTMQKRRVRHAPVVEEGRLVGILSDRDLLRPLGEEALVRDAMTKAVQTISPNAHLEDAARRMLGAGVDSLLVVHEGELVGIATSTDLVRAFVDVALGGGGRRVSWIRSGPRPSARFDLPAACAQFGLRLTSLLRHHAPNDCEVLTARIEGPEPAFEQLLSDAFAHGFRLLETAPEPARKPA